MSTNVGSISFDLQVDTSGIKTSIQDCASKVNQKMTTAFQNTGKNVESSLQQLQSAIERTSNTLEKQTINLQAQQNAVSQLEAKLVQLKDKYEQQTSAIQKQENEVQRLETEYKQLSDAMGQLGVPTAQQVRQLEKLGKQLENAKSKLSSLKDRATTTKNSIDKTSNSLNVANLRLQKTQMATDKTEKELEELKRSFEQLSKSSKQVTGLERSIRNLGNSSKEFDKVADSMKQLQGVDGLSSKFNGLTSCIKKIGAAMLAAFAVHKLVDFGKEAIELGSDLAEVQNVVDVTFPNMSKRIDEFSQNAITQFGLSEIMAKQFTGTFGAMAKAFGFNEKAAYDMSTALTGLAGDVASFYNINQEEAYTKLKSVFTGETESLKDLGVVMTQSALDAYALANGFGKTTQKMSEAEKVALRFAFVQEKLALASGDFARTSDGWANQIRILKLNFDSLKATIGQGLINILLPVVKVINMVISKLMVLANAFKAFTELITGNKSEEGTGVANSGMQETGNAADMASQGMDGASDSAKDMAKATKGAGKAAKKAAKDMKALLSIDEIHKIGDNASDKSDSDGKGNSGKGKSNPGVGGITADNVDMGKLAEGDTVIDKLDSKFAGLINRLKELANLFQQGFTLGIGDLSVFESIHTNLERIKSSIVNIGSDKGVQKAANNFLNSFSFNLGKVAGSFVSVGATIADNVTGGIANYLEQNTGTIKEFLIDMFNIESEVAQIVGDLAVAFADIFTVFRSEEAKQITADLIAIFANAKMGITKISAKLGRDILKTIVNPLVENKDKIKQALSGTIQALEPIFTAFKDIVTDTFEKINQVYDDYIEPAFNKVSNGLSNIFGSMLDAFNEHVLPVLKKIGKEFQALAKEHIQPMIDSIVEFSGKFIDAIATLWEALSPFIGWVVAQFIEVFAEKLNWLWETVKVIFAHLSDAISGFFKELSGFIDFIVGAFTGDWERAWEGIKEIFSGAWETIKGIVLTVVEGIETMIKGGISIVKKTISSSCDLIVKMLSSLWEQIKTIFSPVGKWFSTKFKEAYQFIVSAFAGLKDWVKEKWNQLTEVFKEVGSWFRTQFTTAYSNLTSAFSNLGTWATGKWKAITEAFKEVATWFGTKFKAAYSNLKSAFSELGTWAKGKWKAVTEAFKEVGNWFNTQFTAAYSNLTSAFSNLGTWATGKWTAITGAFKGVGTWFSTQFKEAYNKMKSSFSGTKKFFSGLWDSIKSGFSGIGKTVGDVIGSAFKKAINGVIAAVEKNINKGIDLINGLLSSLKKIPGIGSKIGSVERLHIPRLAQGGFVKKNTPQLAVIGDNRHQGEVVAPEDKLLEMAKKAATMVGNTGSGSSNSEMIQLQKEMIQLLKQMDFTLYLDSEVVAKANLIGQKRLNRRYNPV